MRTIYRILAIILIGALAMPARAELVNAIEAIVGESIITSQQVDQFCSPAEKSLRSTYGREPEVYQRKLLALIKDSLETLLRRQLILHDFESSGFNIPETIIDEYVQDEIHERYSDRVQFNKELQQQGLTTEAFRKQVRDNLIVREMTHKYVPEPIISPVRIEAYYTDHKDEYKLPDQVRLRTIVLNRPASDFNDSTKRRAGEIVTQIREGASFVQMAEIYSDGSQRGEESGWQNVSILNKPLMDAVNQLTPGKCSNVIETPQAYFIVQLEERREAHVRPLNDLRDEIERTLMIQESSRLQQKWIERLKKKTFIRYF